MLHAIKVRHKCNAISGVIHLCGDGMLRMANRPISYIPYFSFSNYYIYIGIFLLQRLYGAAFISNIL